MTTGERIRRRREELGLTQTELAERMHYKSRAAICNIEKDKEDLTTTRIKKIAEALQTTPSYLMGWEEPDNADPSKSIRELYQYLDAETIEKAENDPQLMEFIQLFLNTSEENRPAVLQILKGLQPRS